MMFRNLMMNGGFPIPSIIGDTFNDDFVRASLGGDYTKIGSNATFAISSNKLRVTKENTSLPNDNVLYYNNSTRSLNNPYARLTFTLITKNSNCIGLDVGWRYFLTSPSGSYNLRSVYAGTTFTGANLGKAIWFQQSYNNSTATTTNTVTINDTDPIPSIDVGDSLTIEIEIVNKLLTATITNNTKGTSASIVPYQFGLDATTNQMTTYWPAIFARGGTYDITEYVDGSNDYKNIPVCWISDGVGQDQRATSYNNSIQNQLNLSLGGTNGSLTKLTKCAMPTNFVYSLVDNNAMDYYLNKIDAFYYCIMLGGNDGEFSVNVTDYLNDLDTMIDAFYNAGKRVVLITPPGIASPNDISSYANGILTNFTGDSRLHRLIDVYSMSITSLASPYLKTEFLESGSNGKLNDFASTWYPTQDENYTICNKIAKNWSITPY